MAGESADEVARRAREKAERLLRHAEAYEKGAAGERLVQQALATLPPEWTVFHDLHWPGRARANVDHLVVGPAGVFVIDSKNWSGSASAHGGVLRQNGYSRTTAVDGVRAAARAVAQLVPALSPGAFVPVLCFTGEAAVDTNLGGVVACRVTSLISMLTSRPPVLSSEWLEFLRFELDMSTRAATGPHAGDLTMPVWTQQSPRRAAGSDRRTPSRRRVPRVIRLIRRIAVGIAAWWVACELVYLTVGRATQSGAVLGPIYLVLAVMAARVVVRRIRD